MKRDVKSLGSVHEEEVRLIGCCGAYCRTCRSFVLGHCKGCKVGYEDGRRAISRARCKIKVCCFGVRKHETCAECTECADCKALKAFHNKQGNEYRGYKRSLEFIRERGYPEFVMRGRNWKRAHGELDDLPD